MKTLCYKCILPSLLAIQQDVTYATLAGVRRLRITKIPLWNRQKTLTRTKLLLDTLSVSCNEMIGSQIAVADVFLSPQLFAAVAAELMVYQSRKHEKDR